MKLTTEEKMQIVTQYHNGESATDICKEADISRSTFYTWLTPYKTTIIGAGHMANTAKFVKVKKKIEKLEQKIEMPQTVNCTVSSPLKKR